jgi:hypothetical protein
MSEGQIVEAIDPESAFAALADDLRIEILRALWCADDHEATFSELRAAVGNPDSGQFNYHLGQLTEQFVTKTHEGYRLTLAADGTEALPSPERRTRPLGGGVSAHRSRLEDRHEVAGIAGFRFGCPENTPRGQ